MKEDMVMKTNKIDSSKVISYWVITLFTAFELLAGGVTDLVHGKTALVAGEPVAGVLAHLGYPVYLLTILGAWKLLGAIALLVPRFPRLKEWAYAGSFFVYMGAVVSGMIRGSNDPGTFIWPPLIFAMLTLASWALRPRNRILGTLLLDNGGGKMEADAQ